MLILYTIAPLLYRMASSAFYNISLLSVNFFGLLFGLGLYVCSFEIHVIRQSSDSLYSTTDHTSCTLSRLWWLSSGYLCTFGHRDVSFVICSLYRILKSSL